MNEVRRYLGTCMRQRKRIKVSGQNYHERFGCLFCLFCLLTAATTSFSPSTDHRPPVPLATAQLLQKWTTLPAQNVKRHLPPTCNKKPIPTWLTGTRSQLSMATTTTITLQPQNDRLCRPSSVMPRPWQWQSLLKMGLKTHSIQTPCPKDILGFSKLGAICPCTPKGMHAPLIRRG